MFATQVYEAKNLMQILMEMYETESNTLRAGAVGVACVLDRRELQHSLMSTIFDKLDTIQKAMDLEDKK